MENCGNCKFAFQPINAPGRILCRRFPAQIVAGPKNMMHCFPEMLHDGWCGEWKLKLEKAQ